MVCPWLSNGSVDLQTSIFKIASAVIHLLLGEGLLTPPRIATTPMCKHGSSTALQIDNSPIKRFLLKFDVTGINGGQVTNAKLCLYNVDGANEGGDFYSVSDDSWQEETVTWNNAPAADTTLPFADYHVEDVYF